MIKGLGTQVVEIRLVQASFDRNGESYVRRMLSAQELSTWQTHRQPVLLLAKIQACKEAIAKALHTQIGQGLAYRDLQLSSIDDVIKVNFSGGAEVRYQRLGVEQLLVSMGVSQNYVTATAIIQ